MKRRYLIPAGVVVLALIVGGVLLVTRPGDQVATVDGHAITRDELAFHMRRLAATPGGDLRARALAEAEKDKVLMLMAKEQGLVGSVDHADFVKSVGDENARRANAKRDGEVVYGLTEFTPEEFYGKRITDLATELRKRQPVTDAEVRAAFDRDRAAWSANATTYTYSKLVVPASAPLRGNELTGPVTTATYAGGGVNAHDQELLAVLTPLKPGQTSAPVRSGDQLTYYRLDRRTVDEKAAFAQYAPRIRQSITGEKFSQLLEKRLAGSDIKVDAEAMADVDAEEVQ
ncbi:peptidylprolyl isomerase [Actinoplanes solisilvae]|uniref:peptidylprolyl isomerase n=1 Tax=Actinoplanes solisilvae TaxID=2486853 RepID=UPI000FD82CA8|nr:hypothetical protein [Actinoplanes solisilvae]